MDFKLFFNVGFAWAGAVLAFLASIIWILRVMIKKKIIPAKSFLGRSNRSLRIAHNGIGIAFVVTGVLHAVFSSQALFSLNYGTVLIVLAILLAAMYFVKKKMKRKTWMLLHRTLTVMVIVGLGLHIYDIGGAPATTRLVAELTGKAEAPSESDALVALAQTGSGTTAAGSGQMTFMDGTYTGTADGYGPDLTVRVTVENGVLADVFVVSHNEVGEQYYARALESIPNTIVESQSIAVDSVSGATYTSVGIKNAVADALAQAVTNGEVLMTEPLPESGGGRGGGGGRRHGQQNREEGEAEYAVENED